MLSAEREPLGSASRLHFTKFSFSYTTYLVAIPPLIKSTPTFVLNVIHVAVYVYFFLKQARLRCSLIVPFYAQE